MHFFGREDGFLGVVEDGHQSIAQGLDDLAAMIFHDAGHDIDAVRDHRGRFGIAEALVQGGAAAKVGKKHGAVDRLRHVPSVTWAFVRTVTRYNM